MITRDYSELCTLSTLKHCRNIKKTKKQNETLKMFECLNQNSYSSKFNFIEMSCKKTK